MKKHTNVYCCGFVSLICLFLFNCTAFCEIQEQQDEFKKLYDTWMSECAVKRKALLTCSILNVETPAFFKLVSFGKNNMEVLLDAYRKEKGNRSIARIFYEVTKLTLEEDLDWASNNMILQDYPYSYTIYPFVKDKNNFNTPDIYWWDHGRQMTPQLFAKKYADYQAAKKSGNEKDIKAKYTRLQNMGVIILPDLLAKIEAGETDLIPMFSELGDQKDLKTAAVCRAWWEANKKRYEVILDYKKDSKEKK